MRNIVDRSDPVYIEYELMQLPGSDKYYMYELQTTKGEFDVETSGYTKTGEIVDGYVKYNMIGKSTSAK